VDRRRLVVILPPSVTGRIGLDEMARTLDADQNLGSLETMAVLT
jgi:hypothetical protein